RGRGRPRRGRGRGRHGRRGGRGGRPATRLPAPDQLAAVVVQRQVLHAGRGRVVRGVPRPGRLELELHLAVVLRLAAGEAQRPRAVDVEVVRRAGPLRRAGRRLAVAVRRGDRDLGGGGRAVEG